MEQSFLYSIGHGNKPIEEFIDELNQFDIKFLIDIRYNTLFKVLSVV